MTLASERERVCEAVRSSYPTQRRIESVSSKGENFPVLGEEFFGNWDGRRNMFPAAWNSARGVCTTSASIIQITAFENTICT